MFSTVGHNLAVSHVGKAVDGGTFESSYHTRLDAPRVHLDITADSDEQVIAGGLQCSNFHAGRDFTQLHRFTFVSRLFCIPYGIVYLVS